MAFLLDCLGATLEEAQEVLSSLGFTLKSLSFTGPWGPPPGEEGKARVVRIREEGNREVHLTLVYLDIKPEGR